MDIVYDETKNIVRSSVQQNFTYTGTRTEFSHKTSQLSHVKVVSFMLEEYAN